MLRSLSPQSDHQDRAQTAEHEGGRSLLFRHVEETCVENLFCLLCSCWVLAFAQIPSQCERNCSTVRKVMRIGREDYQ